MQGLALDPLGWRPPRAERFGVGAALALLAHAGLVVALALGLHWRNDAPVVASAELWSAVPQIAAPAPTPAPAPAPAPPTPQARREPAPPAPDQRDAEIALERARIEKQKAAAVARQHAQEAADQAKALAAAKAAEDKRQQHLKEEHEAEAEAQRIAKAREDNLKRMLAQAGSAGTGTNAGTAARDAGPSASYAGRIKARIKPNIKLLTEVAGNPIAEVEVRCATDGEIIGRRIVKASGNPVWDETVLRAIDTTRMLPRDTDGRIPATMTLVFSPRDM